MGVTEDTLSGSEGEMLRKAFQMAGGFPEAFASRTRYSSLESLIDIESGERQDETPYIRRMIELAQPLTSDDTAILGALGIYGKNADRLHRLQRLATAIALDGNPKPAADSVYGRAKKLVGIMNHDDILRLASYDEVQEHPTYYPAFSVWGTIPWFSGTHGSAIFSCELMQRAASLASPELNNKRELYALLITGSSIMDWVGTVAKFPLIQNENNNWMERDIVLPSHSILERLLAAVRIPKEFIEEFLGGADLPRDAWTSLSLDALNSGFEEETDVGLARPIHDSENNLVLYNPHAFCIGFNHAILRHVVKNGDAELFRMAYWAVIQDILSESFASLGTKSIKLELPRNDYGETIMAASVELDARRAMFTLVVPDPITDYNPPSPFKMSKVRADTDLGPLVEDAVAALRKLGYDDVTLLVISHQISRPMTTKLNLLKTSANRCLNLPLETFYDTSRSQVGNRFFGHSYSEAWTKLRKVQIRQFPEEDEVLGQYLREGCRFPALPFTFPVSSVYGGLAADTGLDSETLLRQLVEYQESIIAHEELFHLHATHNLPAFKTTKEWEESEREKLRVIEMANLASRFLVEYVSTLPPQLGEDISEGDLHNLLALAFWHTNTGTMLQVLRLSPSSREVYYMPGRSNALIGKDLHRDVQRMSRMRSESLFRYGSEHQDEYRPDVRRELPPNLQPDPILFSEMLKDEWGVSLLTFSTLVREFSTHHDADEFGIYEATPEKFCADLASFGILQTEVAPILAAFGLHSLPSGEADAYLSGDKAIWVHRRRRSYLHCPILVRPGRITIGGRRLYKSFRYVMELLRDGTYAATSGAVNSRMGQQRNDGGSGFEKGVRERFSSNRRRIVYITPTDPLVGKPDCAILEDGILHLIECKAINKPMTAKGERGIRDVIKKANEQLLKLEAWIKANPTELSEPVNEIRKWIVVSRDIYPSTRASVPMPVLTVAQLEDLLKQGKPMKEWRTH